jgi:AcrR family transcriptional regulator
MLVELTRDPVEQSIRQEGDVGVRAAATEATGQRILDAATALFGEQLFDQVSLAAVAQQAGVTVQTVIRRFGSKEQLHLTVARRRSVELRAARDAAPVGDVAGALTLLLEGYERWGEEILHLLAQERRSPVIGEILDGARRYHQAWVARMFAPQLAHLEASPRQQHELGQQHELAKLVAATDLYTWKVLRHDTRLDADQTRIAITEIVTAIIDRLEPHDQDS